MTAPLAPSPAHLLRSHSAPISCLSFSDDNERIYSGDGSGLVVVTSTRSLRALTSWKAHTDGLLGVQEWGARVITHGRDNKLHVWARIEELPSSSRLGGSAALPGLPTPSLCYSMDVNALNYCRFSLMTLPMALESSGLYESGERPMQALIALPNLVESSLADIWSLPSCQRIHAAIGKAVDRSFAADGRGATGIIMSLHLFSVPTSHPRPSSSEDHADELRLLCAYENGGVALRRYANTVKQTSVEGIGWEIIWEVKLHVETIMAMRISKDNTLALTVSADHLVGRYDLVGPPESSCVAHRTKHPGNGAIAIRDDGKVCAIGGWDGKIRLYSTRTLKPLGTLTYHKSGCQAVEFARSIDGAKTSSATGEQPSVESDEDDDEMSEKERAERARWLVGGGKDNRVSIWALMSFEK